MEGTAGESEEHNPRGHGFRKSDEAIVVKKPANKASGALAAERAERRASAKRNSRNPPEAGTRSPAESEAGLLRIRAAARKDRTLRFNNLLHHLDVESLQRAYEGLKRDAAPGVDGTIQARLKSMERRRKRASAVPKKADKAAPSPPLLAFQARTAGNAAAPLAIPFALKDYLELLDWTGRALRDGKTGAIPEPAPKILTRLNLNPDIWLHQLPTLENDYAIGIGAESRLRQFGQLLKRHWLRGVGVSRRLYR